MRCTSKEGAPVNKKSTHTLIPELVSERITNVIKGLGLVLLYSCMPWGF